VAVICECDVALTRRIIENLLSNAIRRTMPDGHIAVSVSHGKQRVRLVVEDKGPSIPAEDCERIFERSPSQGMYKSSGHHSLCVGLAFCKLAVTAHGGSIRVEEAHPRGNRFVVELP
jgi:K+-sensing histidine kinase KdpD